MVKPKKITLDARAIGKRVRKARLKREWLQRQLADASGIDDSVIGGIEVGSRLPSRDTAISLCATLHRSLEWLYFGTEKRGQWWKSI